MAHRKVVFRFELDLYDAVCLRPDEEDVMVIWSVVLGRDPVQIVKEAAKNAFLRPALGPT